MKMIQSIKDFNHMPLTNREINTIIRNLIWKIEISIGGATKPYVIRDQSAFAAGLSGKMTYSFNNAYTPGQITKDFCILIDRRINEVKSEYYFSKVLKNNRDIMVQVLEAIKTPNFWFNYMNKFESTEFLITFYSINWTKNDYWVNSMTSIYGFGKETFINALRKYLENYK
jgi:hypothetical protein